ncbi:flagellar basal-body rod protein FlgG [Phycisphaerales bacterium AB-hyl4]|uniref:Flagellar basal-body rod protein FlgG n=1 Tax=Natronomicrosphaera hydrolytica TaxID=3242702 RepID=A0ABV4U5X7_9BACT
MAITALHSASTGLSALSTGLDVIANNLANINTTGFKGSRVNFEDLIYQEKAQPGVENANGDQRPTGTYVGLGTRVSGTQINFEQGDFVETGRQLDFALEGNGFFQVNILEDQGGIGYTRAGNFFVNAEGDVVLGNTDGPRIEPPINVPDQTLRVQVTNDGTVFAQVPGQVDPVEVGEIELAAFVNPAGLKAIGGNLYAETAASGPPINGQPGEGQFGTIIQGFLEGSNVNPVTELVELIKTQRAFELNSQSIQAADEALQVVSNLRRF